MTELHNIDRILATVLFTDIVGSTELASEMGDQRWRELLDAHHARVRVELEQFNGREVKTMGDGFLATFDSPARAVLCARAIAESMAAIGVHIRAGIHTGETEIMGDDVGGIAVHIAARVAGRAEPDEILVSSTVKDLVEGSHIAFAPKGTRGLALKGIPGRWRLFAVVWQPPRTEPTGLPRRREYPLVGRVSEMAVAKAQVDAAAGGALRVLCVEGEPGIGKTRLLDETAAYAVERGFSVAFVGADEEVTGPFLLARAILSSPAVVGAADAAGRRALKAAEEALGGPAEPELASFTAEDRMVNVFDRAAVALRAVATRKPLYLALDDLQWADEDSVRLIRYLARTDPNVPLLLVLAYRREAAQGASALLGLSVDAERLGVGRRVTLERLTPAEGTELLQHLLGGPASTACAGALFAQSEGVPFILEELVRAFRESGTVRSIEGTWELAGSVRMVPSSVQSLIERKAAALPDATREALGDAAAIGRRFALADLAAVTRALRGGDAPGPADLASMLTPAVLGGLLAELPEGGRADYSFTHDSARAVLAEAQGRPRRKLAHRAVLDLIADGGEPPRHRLAEAAHHALLGGEPERGVRYSIEAARDTLAAGAADEALRIANGAYDAAAEADDQLELLRIQDDALDMLGRPGDRGRVLEKLAKALEGRRDEDLEFELMRRRASAARTAGDVELAADLARLTREQAAAAGNRRAELEACLELGQAIVREQLGEGYNPAPTEVDLDAAAEAFERALALAEEEGDERAVAACLRELGVIENGRAKGKSIELIAPHALASGRFQLPPEDDPIWAPIDQIHAGAKKYLERALEIFERLDDRAGVMSTVIALSYSHYHSGVERGVAGVIEQIRKLRSRLKSMTTESERQRDEGEMLFSIHAYARFYHYADLALQRGVEAHRAARTFGIRWLEFAAAGGVALTHIELGEPDEAEEWLDKARAAAMVQLGPLRARQLDLWRGLARAAAGDTEGALEHLERALALALEQRSRPGQAEAMVTLALQMALLAAESNDAKLARRAEPRADAALALAAQNAGQHPWRAQARAASAQLALLRGDTAAAADLAAVAVAEMDARWLEPVLFEVLLVAARAAQAADGPNRDQVFERIRWDVQDVAGRILDEDVRARWLAAPVQAAIVDIVGKPEPGAERRASGRAARLLSDHELRILAAVAKGMTNREIAAELDQDVRAIGKDLSGVFTKLGVRSRAAATTIALREGLT